MSSKVDWLSFTLPCLLEAPNDEAYALSIERAFYDHFGLEITDAVFGGKWEHREKGRAPYTDTWERKDAPILMFTSRNLRHLTVEFSGQGCDWLRSNDLLYKVLEGVKERVTRIDIATDFATTVTPEDFVHAGYSNRFTATGIYTSASGQTVYVGSQKSERFARVYRYAPPHPRSNLLRVECVLRRDVAKQSLAFLLCHDEKRLADALGASFEWKHPLWASHADATDTLSLARGERSNANTVRWLITSVAPAFKRLVSEGEIPDAEQFVRQVFLS